jgi:hypothetical protein
MMTIMIALAAAALPLETPARVKPQEPSHGCKTYFRRMSAAARPANGAPCFQLAANSSQFPKFR